MATEDLCTIADVVGAWPAFAQINANEQAKLIDVASDKILNFCRRPGFIQVTMNEFIDGSNSSRIWLSMRPVISVNSITINGEPVDNTNLDAWGFNPKTGELWRGVGQRDNRFSRWFASGSQNIQVGYLAGYGQIPPQINRAAILYVRYLVEQFKISGVYSSESIGDYSYSLNAALVGYGGLPAHVAALCMDYVQDDAFA